MSPVDQAILMVENDIEETKKYLEERLDKQDSRLDSIYNWTVFGLFGLLGATVMAAASIIAVLIATK